jgi:hypothetical protein
VDEVSGEVGGVEVLLVEDEAPSLGGLGGAAEVDVVLDEDVAELVEGIELAVLPPALLLLDVV